MSKKKHRPSLVASLKRALRKYGCFLLFPAAWTIVPQPYLPAVIAFLALPCYANIEIFNWLEDQKSDHRTKRIKLLARFWRYGYIYLVSAFLPMSSLLGCPRQFLFFSVLLYGVYTFFITFTMCRHFICGMQDASHQPMNPWKRNIPASEYRRDGLFIGLFAFAIAFFGLTLV